MPKGRKLFVAIQPTKGTRIIKGQYGTFAKTSYGNVMNEMKKQDLRTCQSANRYVKEKLEKNDEITIALQHYKNTVIFERKFDKKKLLEELL